MIFKHKLTVVLDIDGVIADFETEFCMQFGDKSRHLVNLEHRYPEQKDSIQNFVGDRNTYRYLLPIPVGCLIADWLTTQRAIVHVVSSRPVNSYEITKKWLSDKGVVYNGELIISRNKSKQIEQLKPDIIVDDIIKVCTQAYFDIPDVHPILIAHPWNDTVFFPRITRLEQFQRLFKRVADEKLLTDSDGVELA